MKSRQHLISIMKGVTSGTALWCMLMTLRLLSGTVADTSGLLLIVALALAATLAAGHRVVLACLATLAGAVMLVSFSALAPTVAARWIRQSAIPAGGVEAVVVLSGGLNPDTTVSSDAVDRLLTGLDLVNGGTAPLLVTTRTQEIFPTGVVMSEIDQSRILRPLSPGVVWLQAWGGNSTRDEATGVAKLLRDRNVRRIAVVTSPMHTRRACAVFEAVGFVVSCTPARMRDETGLPTAQLPLNRLTLFGQWIYEIAAMADYSGHGWLKQRTQQFPIAAWDICSNMLNQNQMCMHPLVNSHIVRM